MPFGQALGNDRQHAIHVEVEQRTARAQRHHVGHDGVTARVVVDAMRLHGLAHDVVIGQRQQSHVVPPEILVGDTGLCVDDNRAARHNLMQMTAVRLVVLVRVGAVDRLGVQR